MDVWYSPGTWLAVSGAQVHALADLDPGSSVLAEWSQSAQAGAGPDQLLAVVMRGLESVPSFAFCQARPDGLRIVVRGDARVWLADGRELSAEGAPTWRDGIVALEAAPIRLCGPHQASNAARLPLSGGVVFAASIDLYLAAAPVDPPLASPLPATPPAVVPPAAELPAVELPAPVVAAVSIPPVEPVGDVAAAADYAHLFGPTTSPPPVPTDLDRVGRSVAPEDTLFTRPETQVAAPAPDFDAHDEQVNRAPESISPPAVVDGGVISAFPWAGAGAGAVQPAPAIQDDRPDVGSWRQAVTPEPDPAPESSTWGLPSAPTAVSDHTVARSLLPSTPAPVGPTVLAAYCPAGHLSPVHAHACRVCDRPIAPNQQPMTIARPTLGVIRLPGGQTIPLDRSVLLGRAPVPPESAAPGEQPHAVSLASPEKDISRNHVEIRLDGWHVLAVDLGSVNGTVVVQPGRPPQRLRPDEAVILERGADVVLADEVTVTFEVPA